MINYVLNAELL